MKKLIAFLTSIILCIGMPASAFAVPSSGAAEPRYSSSSQIQQPFYGIWCGASKDRRDMERLADSLSAKGFSAKVFLTTDWSDLNVEPWYVAAAGTYAARAAAESALPLVQVYYPDAYVKYSGNWQGIVDSSQISAPSDPDAGWRTPFYGIWCYASKSYGDAQDFAYDLQCKAWPAAIYVTTDWSNLNSEFWYVVSAGSYTSESSARASLMQVQAICPDAYVKYSGYYQGQ